MFQPYDHGGSNSHTRNDIFSIIGSASKQMLLASNPAYLELFEENLRLKVELEVERCGLKIHSCTKKNLIIGHPPFNPSSFMMSGSKLVIPDPPPPCDRDDFPDVGWWTRTEWTTYVEKQKEGLTNSKLGFRTVLHFRLHG